MLKGGGLVWVGLFVDTSAQHGELQVPIRLFTTWFNEGIVNDRVD